jgi:hypothetical protein
MKYMLLFVLAIVTYKVQGQWSSSPTENLILSHLTEKNNSLAPGAVPDGKNGAVIVWANSQIYGQKLDATGKIQFNAGGINIGLSGGPGISPLTNPKSIPDGNGGAIITWMENSQTAIGASQVKADGTKAWDYLISNTIGFRSNPVITSDGEGGAYIAWQDTRKGSTNSDIYAQRVNAEGKIMWAENGILVCAAANNQINPGIATDDLGGAFISWEDNRKTTSAIFAQRINSLGIPYWLTDGIPVCANNNDPVGGSKIVATGHGEAIITWNNGSSAGTWNIYAQKINLEKPEWTPNGVPICDAPLSQISPEIVADGYGGAIICWRDTRRGISLNEQDLYAQGVNSGGQVQWTKDGVLICIGTGNPAAIQKIITDGKGGAIIAWEDYRNDKTPDIYAQSVNIGGAVQWEPNGIAISNAPSYQKAVTLAEDGKGGAILSWADYRNLTNFLIYTQHIDSKGKLGMTTSIQANTISENHNLKQNYPNPWNFSTTIHYTLTKKSGTNLSLYNAMGQKVLQLVNKIQQAGDYELVLNKNELPGGTYFYRLQAGGNTITRKMILLE